MRPVKERDRIAFIISLTDVRRLIAHRFVPMPHGWGFLFVHKRDLDAMPLRQIVNANGYFFSLYVRDRRGYLLGRLGVALDNFFGMFGMPKSVWVSYYFIPIISFRHGKHVVDISVYPQFLRAEFWPHPDASRPERLYIYDNGQWREEEVDAGQYLDREEWEEIYL